MQLKKTADEFVENLFCRISEKVLIATETKFESKNQIKKLLSKQGPNITIAFLVKYMIMNAR